MAARREAHLFHFAHFNSRGEAMRAHNLVCLAFVIAEFQVVDRELPYSTKQPDT